jgi:tetratricopeptide (TPR) repeat protein
MEPLPPDTTRFRPEDMESYATSPTETERFTGRSDVDRLRSELTLARQCAVGGRLTEALGLIASLTERLGSDVPSAEDAVPRITSAVRSGGGQAAWAAEPSPRMASWTEPVDGAALTVLVTKVRLLTGSSWAVQGDIEDRIGRQQAAEDASTVAVRCFEAVERSTLDGRDLSDFGMALFGADRPGDAVGALRQAIERGASTAQSFRYLGLALMRNKSALEAEASLQRAVELDPDDPWLLSDLAGAIATRASDQETARVAAARYVEAADHHTAAGRVADALADFDRALAADSRYAPALAGKTVTLLTAGRPEEGLAAAELGLYQLTGDTGGTQPTAEREVRQLRSYRAEALRLLGRYEEALAQLDELLDGHNEDAWLLGVKGVTLAALNRPAESEPLLRRSLDVDPGQPWVRQTLIGVLRLGGQRDEALVLLNDVLSHTPQDGWALATKGAILWDEPSRQEEAIGLLRQAVDIDPGSDWARYLLADALRQMQHYDEALRLLDVLRARTPRDPSVLGTRGQVLLSMGRQGEAGEELRQALAINPALDPARRSLAEALSRIGRQDEALLELDELLDRDPRDAWALATKGTVLLDLDKPDEAADLLRRSLALNPGQAWVSRTLAEALRLAGHYDEALTVLEKLLTEQPDNAWTLGTKGQVLSAKGDQDGAVGLLRQALAVDPALLWAAQALAEALRLASRNDEALTALEELLVKLPDDAWTLSKKGQVLSAMGRRDEAVDLFRRALTINPGMDWARRDLAETLRLASRNDEALTALEELLARNPGNAWTLGTKGQVLSAMGRQDQATELLRRARDINPDLDWVRVALAEALRLAGHHDEALTVLDELLIRLPDDPWTLGKKGQVLSAMGHWDKATEPLRRARGIDPELDWVRRELAEALRQAGHIDQALTVLDELLARNPEDPWALSTKGAVLLDLGQPDQAATLLRSHASASTNAFLHSVLAEALRLLSQLDDALAECDRALELDATDPSSWATKGAVLQAMQRHDLALDAFDRALGIDPHYSWAFVAKAGVMIELGEYESSIELADQAAEFGPANDWVLTTKAIALRLLDRAAEAVTVCERALELPGSSPVG